MEMAHTLVAQGTDTRTPCVSQAAALSFPSISVDSVHVDTKRWSERSTAQGTLDAQHSAIRLTLPALAHTSASGQKRKQ